MSNAYTWLKATCGDDSFREIARRAGLSDSIVSRQLSSGAFSYDVAIAIAREYRTSPVAALVSNGHLTEQEAGIESVTSALQAATDEQLVVEIGRRLDVAPSSLLWDAPVSEAVEHAENVTRMEDHRSRPVDDPRAVASEPDGDHDEDDGYDA